MFSRQNEPLQDLLQRAYAHDMSSVRTDPVTGESNSQSPLSMYSNLVHLKAFFLKASAAYSGMMGALSGEGSFAWSVLIGLYEHAKELECRVKCRLLPTPEILQRLQRAQYQERDTELLAIERLLQLLIKKSQLSSGSDVPLFRSVKFSLASSGFQDVAGSMGYGLGTSGTFVLSDCCDSTELLHALNRYVFELIMLLQPERMSPVPRKSEADNRERTGSKRSKYSNLLEDDDSEDEMAMHYVDPARVSNDDSDSDDGGNQAARAQLQLPDTPIDFTSLSPASPKRVVESSRYPESSVQADGLPEVDAHMVMPQRNSPFIMIQQPRSRGGSNTSLVEQAFEEKRLGRTGGTVGKKNIGNLWHGYVDKVKTKIDKLSTNLKATQQSNLVKASLLNSSALVSRAPSAASIQREILQALIHVLDVLKVDPVQSTSQVSLDTSSACFVVTDKVVECMLSHGLLVQVVKPSELAFGVPQSFYHYVDAFESNVVQDHTTLNERCKIGRHVYYNIYRGINTVITK
ncbi:hypothetical protein EON64_03080 [archaeon]|nr:MAG: hypothetical protein EON64_03080 [archaeon]